MRSPFGDILSLNYFRTPEVPRKHRRIVNFLSSVTTRSVSDSGSIFTLQHQAKEGDRYGSFATRRPDGAAQAHRACRPRQQEAGSARVGALQRRNVATAPALRNRDDGYAPDAGSRLGDRAITE